ncbi:hypothetical protein Z517_04476 [Fonsecaea pedrosoi CBS 271.37]|uniref:Uncharacterized protein n=1 Tax=Fonsecaea pedrosoi CBS 271.37 TaxID=1442368 RepID=A0A0D2DUK9_9EURO|nr:uncharacterized protein Z517_04476 [Fonsecaea pedrosoi CBS 271.37]KIW81451.1 hypothetical protein Z517_04476 [Fonsecaea pedrosoi CBS 271.37]
MKSARRLMPEEEVSGMAFTSQGNMENYMNQDKCLYTNTSASICFQILESMRVVYQTLFGFSMFWNEFYYLYARLFGVSKRTKLIALDTSHPAKRRLKLPRACWRPPHPGALHEPQTLHRARVRDGSDARDSTTGWLVLRATTTGAGWYGWDGKDTTSHRAFAKRHYQEDESIFWLNAMSEATLKDSFRLVAEAIFDLREAEVLQDEQSIKHNQRWLLIKRIAPDETLIYQSKVSDRQEETRCQTQDRWIDDPTLDRYLVPFSRGARAYAELYLATAAAFQQYGSPDVHFQGDQDLRELYDNSYQDLEIIGDGVTPLYRPDSHGVRIVVRAA